MLQKLLSILLTIPLNLFAAPFPLMSSELVLSKTNFLLKERGYTLDLVNSDWQMSETKFNQSLSKRAQEELKSSQPTALPAHDSVDDIFLVSNLKQKLSINIQTMKKAISLDILTQKHTKEYAQFGFEILGNKKVNLGNKNLVLIDLYHRIQKKSIRQAIIGNGSGTSSDRIAVLSCEFSTKEDNPDSAASIKNCNAMIQKFSFLDVQTNQQTHKNDKKADAATEETN
jgi:hypothetical protein